MALRAISGFHLDDEDHWVAELVCGHGQHVRHRPPFENREWVTTEAGRASRLGTELDCIYCDMPELPPEAIVYRQTRDFDEETLPAALRTAHRTKAGTWGRIVVLSGRLRYVVLQPDRREWVLRPGVDGHIAPEREHFVEPLGKCAFRVEFLRVGEAPPSSRR